MATVVEQTITLRFSKLVRTDEDGAAALSEQSLMNVLETLPSVLEQLVDDGRVVVEIEL